MNDNLLDRMLAKGDDISRRTVDIQDGIKPKEPDVANKEPDQGLIKSLTEQPKRSDQMPRQKRLPKRNYYCSKCKWSGPKNQLRKGGICPECDDKGFKVKASNEGIKPKEPDVANKEPGQAEIKSLTEEENFSQVKDDADNIEDDNFEDEDEVDPKLGDPDLEPGAAVEEDPFPEKEYFGQNEEKELHYYLIGVKSDEEDTREDIQIQDQEENMIWSAKEKGIDISDVAMAIVEIVKELQVDISFDIFTKYFLPKLKEEPEEEFIDEEPEDENFGSSDDEEKERDTNSRRGEANYERVIKEAGSDFGMNGALVEEEPDRDKMIDTILRVYKTIGRGVGASSSNSIVQDMISSYWGVRSDWVVEEDGILSIDSDELESWNSEREYLKTEVKPDELKALYVMALKALSSKPDGRSGTDYKGGKPFRPSESKVSAKQKKENKIMKTTLTFEGRSFNLTLHENTIIINGRTFPLQQVTIDYYQLTEASDLKYLANDLLRAMKPEDVDALVDEGCEHKFTKITPDFMEVCEICGTKRDSLSKKKKKSLLKKENLSLEKYKKQISDPIRYDNKNNESESKVKERSMKTSKVNEDLDALVEYREDDDETYDHEDIDIETELGHGEKGEIYVAPASGGRADFTIAASINDLVKFVKRWRQGSPITTIFIHQSLRNQIDINVLKRSLRGVDVDLYEGYNKVKVKERIMKTKKVNEDLSTDVKELQKKAETAIKDGDFTEAADLCSRLGAIQVSIGDIGSDDIPVPEDELEPEIEAEETIDDIDDESVDNESVDDDLEEKVVNEEEKPAEEKPAVEEPAVEEPVVASENVAPLDATGKGIMENIFENSRPVKIDETKPRQLEDR